MQQVPSTPLAKGLFVERRTMQVFARAAFEKGDIAILDIANVDAAVSDNDADGASTSGLANIRNPLAGTSAQDTQDYQGGIYVVCLEDIADNGTGEVLLSGEVDECYVHVGSGDIIIGEALVLDTNEVNALTSDAPAATVNKKIVGKALEGVTTATTPALARVLFDGLNGFGTLFTET